MTRRIVPGIAFLASLAGCYTYVPTEVDQVPLRSQVQAVLSTAGEISLRNRVGLQGGRLEGELVERSAEQLMIAVPTTGPFTGPSGEQLVQRIDVPRADVLLVEVREPSTAKTVGLLVGTAGVATAVAILTFGKDRNPGNEVIPPPPPPERIEFRLPYLLRVP